MTFKIQVVIADGEQQGTVEEIITLDKDIEHVGQIGLRLVESKEILKGLQEAVAQAQTSAYLQRQRPCPRCGRRRGGKGHHRVVFRTLFVGVRLRSPRLYRCPCEEHPAKSFSPLTDLLTEHTAPELLYLETKWASLAPYAKVADLLKDVLPVSETLSGATIQNHLRKVAERDEAALGEERVFFADGCPRDWAELPRPEGPITVGIDGGYVRDWDEKKTHFEVIAGKSVPSGRPAKRFAFANGYDEKPKRRLFEVLQRQGLQMNQQITFLSDGGDSVRRLQCYLSPQAEHLLDWFHVTMRITVLQQYARGLVKIDEDVGTEIQGGLERLKWYLWHGNVYEALLELDMVEMLIYDSVALVEGVEDQARLAAVLHRSAPKALLLEVGFDGLVGLPVIGLEHQQVIALPVSDPLCDLLLRPHPESSVTSAPSNSSAREDVGDRRNLVRVRAHRPLG